MRHLAANISSPKVRELHDLFLWRKRAKNEALERVQKVSLKVILGPVYITHQSALSVLELETLRIRRDCLSFTEKCLKSLRHSALIPVEPVTHSHQLRNVELLLSTMLERRNSENLLFPMQRKLNFL